MTGKPAEPPRRVAALRPLGVFWVGVLLLLAAGGATLQVLGPPPTTAVSSLSPSDPPSPSATPSPAPPSGTTATAPAATTPAAAPPAATAPAPAPSTAVATPGSATPPAPITALPQVHGPAGPPPITARIVAGPRVPGAAIPSADPALQEPSGLGDGSFLPRIAGGLAPMRAYAAGAQHPDARPRVAVLLADFAMREADSEQALRILPAAISFAVSPYALRTGAPQAQGERTLAQIERARQSGHELLIALPMEPRGYPLDDPGDRALLTGATAERNADALRWSLSRLGGAVGATGALGSLRGERFAASGQMSVVLAELALRGLLYVDPRPDGKLPSTSPAPPRRAVDMVLDEPGVRTEIAAKLERLEQLARDRGTALGLVSAPTPVAVERLAAWSALLAQRGVVLVPVSALVVQ